MCFGHPQFPVNESSSVQDVMAIQWGLVQLGFKRQMNGSESLIIDGDYGSETRAAVNRRHKNHGTSQTGEVTADFWQRVQQAVKAEGKC